MSSTTLDRQDITGLILAGGRGTRMGGVDKGLQVWARQPSSADIAMVSAPEITDGGERVLRPQPVFCLMATHLTSSLLQYLASGQRKIDRWTELHRTVQVPFNLAQDDPDAFANINTLTDLNSLPCAP